MTNLLLLKQEHVDGYVQVTDEDAIATARRLAREEGIFAGDVRYYENIEGGHGGAANNQQAAHMQALAYTFLWLELGKQP